MGSLPGFIPRIASARAAFDRRRLLTVKPSRAFFAIFCRRLAWVPAGKRVGQATNKGFCVKSKTRRANRRTAVIRNRARPLWVACGLRLGKDFLT
jgi:hypothetical protein